MLQFYMNEVIDTIEDILSKYNCECFEFDKENMILKNISVCSQINKVVPLITGDLVKRNIEYEFTNNKDIVINKK